MGASAISIPKIIDPEILEAMATNEALSLALDLTCNMVIITTDCMATVNHLRDVLLGPSAAIIHEIKSHMKSFALVEVVHGERSMNIEAHTLAKAATTLPHGQHVWLVNRPVIIYISENILA